MDYQRIILLGNASRDAEIKQAKETGNKYADFTVAVRYGKDQPTTFFPVRVFGPPSEHCEKIKKGDRVMVDGRLEVSEYTDDEGDKKMSYRVVADTYRRL